MSGIEAKEGANAFGDAVIVLLPSEFARMVHMNVAAAEDPDEEKVVYGKQRHVACEEVQLVSAVVRTVFNVQFPAGKELLEGEIGTAGAELSGGWLFLLSGQNTFMVTLLGRVHTQQYVFPYGLIQSLIPKPIHQDTISSHIELISVSKFRG